MTYARARRGLCISSRGEVMTARRLNRLPVISTSRLGTGASLVQGRRDPCRPTMTGPSASPDPDDGVVDKGYCRCCLYSAFNDAPVVTKTPKGATTTISNERATTLLYVTGSHSKLPSAIDQSGNFDLSDFIDHIAVARPTPTDLPHDRSISMRSSGQTNRL